VKQRRLLKKKAIYEIKKTTQDMKGIEQRYRKPQKKGSKRNPGNKSFLK
jgi:hypothetical protein